MSGQYARWVWLALAVFNGLIAVAHLIAGTVEFYMFAIATLALVCALKDDDIYRLERAAREAEMARMARRFE